MFIINDIELLVRLGKHKLLQSMLTRCAMAISAFKLSQYSFSVQKEFEASAKVPIMNCDGEFMQWYHGKGEIASVGDLSSMFVAKQNSGTLVLSHEENPLTVVAARYGITYMEFDDFVFQNATDVRMIEFYNLIKQVA
jgi:hypothetical protein